MIQFRSVATGLILAILSGAASADPRFTNRTYAPNTIVTLHGKPGIESAIAFANDERIENIAVGNSATWDVNPNKRANVVFVKPTSTRARTNMTVITDQRTYLFDLVGSGGAPVYMMHFSYPDASKPASTAGALQPTAIAAATPDSTRPQRVRPVPAPLNFSWRGAGEKRLLPASYFDDGASTFLRWASDIPLPAILVRSADGAEGPVNYTVQGDYIVVEGVPAQLVLRSGRQFATLTPARRSTNASTATASAAPINLQHAPERASQ